MGIAAASWAVSVAVLQLCVGVEIGGAARQREERIELQLKSRDSTPPERKQQPERSHEEPIEPWELVGV